MSQRGLQRLNAYSVTVLPSLKGLDTRDLQSSQQATSVTAKQHAPGVVAPVIIQERSLLAKQRFRAHSTSLILASKAATLSKEELEAVSNRVKKLQIEQEHAERLQNNTLKKLQFHKHQFEEHQRQQREKQAQRERTRQETNDLHQVAQTRRADMRNERIRVRDNLFEVRRNEKDRVKLMVRQMEDEHKRFLEDEQEKRRQLRERVLDSLQQGHSRRLNFVSTRQKQLRAESQEVIRDTEEKIQQFDKKVAQLLLVEQKLMQKLADAESIASGYREDIGKLSTGSGHASVVLATTSSVSKGQTSSRLKV